MCSTPARDTAKGRAIARDPRLALCVDIERAAVRVRAGPGRGDGDARTPRSWSRSATLIGRRYMGADRAEEFGAAQRRARRAAGEGAADEGGDRPGRHRLSGAAAATARPLHGGDMTSTASLARYRVGDLDRHPRRLRRHAARRAAASSGRPPTATRAIAVLREVVELGINHIDTSRLLRPARHQRDHPRGARTRTRTTCTSSRRSAPAATSRAAGRTRATPARAAPGRSHDNLGQLGLEALDVVNLRMRRRRRRPRARLDGRAVRRPRRAAAAGPDPPPRASAP